MKRNIFAVCDLEVDYALNFMDYMNRKKNIPFEIQAFTSVENLIAYGKQTHIELLLISGRAMCREVRDLDIGKIIILSEGVHPPELDQYPSVYKYQSSSDVLREVMACYGAEKKTVADQIAVLKKTTEIIGIFSPLGRIWDYPQILEKTEKINPPFHMATCLSPAYVEQLMWSELGDYVRNLLRKESQKKEN